VRDLYSLNRGAITAHIYAEYYIKVDETILTGMKNIVFAFSQFDQRWITLKQSSLIATLVSLECRVNDSAWFLSGTNGTEPIYGGQRAGGRADGELQKKKSASGRVGGDFADSLL
jgi:hypothetical protein